MRAPGAWRCHDPSAATEDRLGNRRGEPAGRHVGDLTRTSSIGATVPPPVTRNVHASGPSRLPLNPAVTARPEPPIALGRALARAQPGPELVRAERPDAEPRSPSTRPHANSSRRWPAGRSSIPHSHINPRRPAARNLDEILGYHYYTELAHSAGMPAGTTSPKSIEPRDRARNLSRYLDRIDNTVQYSWLAEIARTFHGFDGPITPDIDRRPLSGSRRVGRRPASAWDQEGLGPDEPRSRLPHQRV